MSVPFTRKAFDKGLEILIENNNTLTISDLFAQLEEKLPDMHGQLLSEHADYCLDVFKYGRDLATKISSGSLSKEEAIQKYENYHNVLPKGFAIKIIEKLIANP